MNMVNCTNCENCSNLKVGSGHSLWWPVVIDYVQTYRIEKVLSMSLGRQIMAKKWSWKHWEDCCIYRSVLVILHSCYYSSHWRDFPRFCDYLFDCPYQFGTFGNSLHLFKMGIQTRWGLYDKDQELPPSTSSISTQCQIMPWRPDKELYRLKGS